LAHIVVASAAIAAAIYGFSQKAEADRRKGDAQREAQHAFAAEQRAKEETKKAEELAHAAKTAEEETKREASEANVGLARYSHEAGNDALALAHLAKALRLNSGNHGAAAFMAVLLTQTSWPLPVVGPMRHDSAIISAQFSPDGQRAVTASGDGSARVWDTASGKQIGEAMKHGDWVHSAQFSPDGQRVVTASWDNTARVWDAASGNEIGKPMKHDNLVNSAQFSPDGRRVVTASIDGTVRLWDAATGEPIGQALKHEYTGTSPQSGPKVQENSLCKRSMAIR
jgi:WD domain, G-beta repeat